MTIIRILIASGLLLLAACESSPVRRMELIAQHPEWSQDMVKLIQEGFIAEGMDTDQVRAAWGRPCYTCTGTKKNAATDKWSSWEYMTQVVFFDSNEKVLRWTQK
ncbi:MAG: hypothetical protein RQ715_01195 [Methylococcales bacterium]|nr:hypothetical protein [Methylococcales bacterium]